MSVEENLEVSKKYHQQDPAIMDEIMTQDFLGEQGGSDFSWTLESHKKNWTKVRDQLKDEILEQFGSGDKVCTRFVRSGRFRDKDVKIDMLQIKTFRDGKIAHIWEYWDRKQLED